MIYKLCRCGTKIPYTDTYCPKCKEQIEQRNRDRYKEYNHNKRNKDSQSFYNSKRWHIARDKANREQLGLCLYCLWEQEVEGYCSGSIYSEVVHHIEELVERRDLATEDSNLICLCSIHHNQVHCEYDKGKESKVREQCKLVKILKWFRDNYIDSID